MKKISLFFITCIVMMGLSTSCAEDEGNYIYTDLPEFRVDTVGIQKSLIVTQFKKLDVPSRLVFAGDKSDISYVWSIYSSSVGQGDNLADTLSLDEDFSEVITVKPGSYYLEYSALQNSTGLRAFHRYSLTVESAVGSGLFVFYENNGYADADIVKTPLFNASLTETTYSRKVYSQANSEPLVGTPVGCGFISSDGLVDLFTDQSGARCSSDDMSVISDFNNMFYEAPADARPQACWYENSPMFVNDGKMYMALTGYGAPYFPEARRLPDDTYYAECVSQVYGVAIISFDRSKGRFLWGGMWSSDVEALKNEDLQLPGMSCMRMLHAYPRDSWGNCVHTHAYMQEQGNPANRSLYIITEGYSNSNFTLAQKVDLSACPDIADAAYFSSSVLSPLLFYATSNTLYKVAYSMGTENGNAVPTAVEWQCPTGEEITYMNMFSHRTDNLTNELCKNVIVATYNGTEGKVYILAIDPISGTMSAEPTAVFEGFGLVKAIMYKPK